MYTSDQIRAAGISGEISSIDVEHLIKILEESKFKLNLHQRRDQEKAKVHLCKNCGSEIKRWTMDDMQNCTLTCCCDNCGQWNLYSYWP